MQIGYARSSTIDQEAGYQGQVRALNAAGCTKLFAEKVSSDDVFVPDFTAL
jgi:DNA invertase Pin-like site-specific DNA recombinase